MSETLSAENHAVMIVGHGSLRTGSGASMIRLAAQLRSTGIAPITQAAFLNYTRPSVAEGVARCIARGARMITVVPYFLVPGWFVQKTLPKQLAECRQQHPGIRIQQADALGDHPALAELVLKRAAEAAPANSTPADTSLLMIAHGSPDASNNRPIDAVAERVRDSAIYAAVAVCYMDLNEPAFADAVDAAIAQGARTIITVPFFLQLGNHVAEDLPELAAQAQARHPESQQVLAAHLGFDRLLVAPLADRARECMAANEGVLSFEF